MPGKRNSLHYKLAKHAVLLALLLGFVFSSAQVLFDLEKERGNFERSIDELLKATKQSASEAAYSLDVEYSKTIVEGLAKFDEISSVSIYDDRSNLLATAKSGFEVSADQFFLGTVLSWVSGYIVQNRNVYLAELVKQDTGEKAGSIKFEINSNLLGTVFLDHAKVIFVVGFFKNVILMFVFVLLFYFMLSRPLVSAIREISEFDDTKDEASMQFGASLIKRKDELAELVVAFLQLLRRRKHAEDQLRHMAFHDTLTNLPNRALFLDRLDHAIVSAKRNGIYGAVLYMDLDKFKDINDSLGHQVGDQLLEKVADRLIHEFRAEDTVARLGGDEFVVLLEELDKSLEEAEFKAQSQATKVSECLQKSIFLSGQELIVSPSIGISLFPLADASAEDLLKQADTAMYQAKAKGGGSCQFYSSEMQRIVDQRLLMEKELRHAIFNEELMLNYQPQCDAQGELAGVEVLVRWNHPEKGIILPDNFISVAESSGLIVPLGEWVLKTACQDLKKYSATVGGRFSVNISARQFHQDDFVENVAYIIRETGIAAHLVTLEVTENIMIGSMGKTVEKLKALQNFGIEFSIDDFGTGYSSLKYLQQLPFSEIKIDKSFIDDIETDSGDAAIVETIISMAEHLGMRVVSEGVEHESQLNFLKQNHCNTFQGYLFSEPLAINEFLEYAGCTETDHLTC